MHNNISLFLKLQNMNIKKSNTYKLYLALQLKLKLKPWQLESLLGLGEYRNLSDLATEIGT